MEVQFRLPDGYPDELPEVTITSGTGLEAGEMREMERQVSQQVSLDWGRGRERGKETGRRKEGGRETREREELCRKERGWREGGLEKRSHSNSATNTTYYIHVHT